MSDRHKTAPASRTSWGGGLYYVAAMAALAAMDGCAKFLVSDYHVGQVLFLRAAFALPVLTLFIAQTGPLLILPRSAHGLHAVRLVVMGIAAALFFFSLQHLDLAHATAITLLAPVLMSVLGLWVFNEACSASKIVLLGCAVVGGVIIVQPWTLDWSMLYAGDLSTLALSFAVASATLYALTMALTRALALRGEASSMMAITPIGIAFLALPFALMTWVTPVWTDLLIFALMGLCGGLTTIFTVRALDLAPLSDIAPLDYSVFLCNGLDGVLYLMGISQRELAVEETVAIPAENSLVG